MGIMTKFFNQTRKPEGVLGKLMLSSMNSGHAKMADWGLSHLPALSPDRIVELGCGAGRNAGELLKKYPGAHVTAIDYSALSVEKAGEYNRESIAAGRCVVAQGDVSDLRLPAESSIWRRRLRRSISGRGSRTASPRWRRCSGRALIF